MTAIWKSDGERWAPVSPKGFLDEAALHRLVEEATQMLPLSGAGQLMVVGREVQLGNGYADLIAMEPNGRLAIIEVKLARNSEARRAVVAQILTYAAYLHGMDVETLETTVLTRHLQSRGFQDLLALAKAHDQEGAVDDATFAESLAESLQTGAFRLVLVLDDAPDELVRLVGYLEAVSTGLLIDLITVSSFDIDGVEVLVPQRIDPELPTTELDTGHRRRSARQRGIQSPGADQFRKAIAEAPEEHQTLLERLTSWAESLQREGLVTLSTYQGVADRWTLLPRLQPSDVGLVTIWNDHGVYLSVYRSVFERFAPNSTESVEEQIAPLTIGQGNSIKVITSELLNVLTEAYREAAAQSASVSEI